MKFWIHTDPNMQQACAKGLVRAINGDWTDGTEADRVRDFRGFVIYHAWVANEFGGTATIGSSSRSSAAQAKIEPVMSPDPERARVQKAVLRSAELLARGAGMGENWFIPDQVTTGPVPEVGVVPVVAAIAIALADTAQWAAIAWLGVNAAKVLDNYLSRNQKAKDFAAVDAQAIKVLELHAENEQKLGHAEPLNDVEKKILDILEARSEAFDRVVQEQLALNPFAGSDAAAGFGWGAFVGALGVVGAGVALNHFFSRAA